MVAVSVHGVKNLSAVSIGERNLFRPQATTLFSLGYGEDDGPKDMAGRRELRSCQEFPSHRTIEGMHGGTKLQRRYV